MSAQEKLIRYCKVDTQSDPKSGLHPSSAKQFDLAKILVEELKALGVADAACDEHCYVYGHIPANTETDAKTVGFAAHMDTAPDFSGTGVVPTIIENYDGKDITLASGRVTRVDNFPYMKTLVGKTLMVTDGNTLLGADDKAGVAAIMEAVEFYYNHPEAKHGNIAIAFTPDEEIGEGPDFFNYDVFGADFAYTMDGDAVHVMSDETFNASSAVVTFKGFSIHPGEAKNRMIDAASVACEYQTSLPSSMTPEHTEGREGFIHLIGMKGSTEEAVLEYIIRDHDAKLLAAKEQLMRNAVAWMNAKYGEGVVSIEIKSSYRNMKEVLDQHPEVSETAVQAMKAVGLEPQNVPIRGGTDGAELSFHGLPCPNLGCGGGNFHGPHEYCVMEELETAVELIKKIVEITAFGE